MPASGHQDHTTSPSALCAIRQKRQSVHRIPPYVFDDRETPLEKDGTATQYYCFYPAVKLNSENRKWPLSSLRTQGPITTEVSCRKKASGRGARTGWPRRMGPCVRRGDEEKIAGSSPACAGTTMNIFGKFARHTPRTQVDRPGMTYLEARLCGLRARMRRFERECGGHVQDFVVGRADVLHGGDGCRGG